MQIASRTSRYLLTAHFSSPIPLERRSTETVVPIASFGVVPSNRKQKNSELAQARRTNLGDECHVVGLWRHHPTDAGARRQWLIVVGPDIGLAPCAGCTSAPTLYVFDLSRRRGSVLSAVSLHGDRASRLNACPDNRRGVVERRAI